jgi:hypothetical protein
MTLVWLVALVPISQLHYVEKQDESADESNCEL